MRPTLWRSAFGVAGASMAVAMRPGTPLNRATRKRVDGLRKRLRYASGELEGLSYRLRGGHPDPDVPDTVLADRVRSELGPLEKQLDLPHVHVMVQDGEVLLHGEVGDAIERTEIERRVAAVSGVEAIASYLHVGLLGSDTRPSEGHLHPGPSRESGELVDAAVTAGAEPAVARALVRSVLANLADALPQWERERVRAHLSADVAGMLHPVRRSGRSAKPRTEAQFVARVSAVSPSLPPASAAAVVDAVLASLKDLVAEQSHTVAAVLPSGLKDLWARN